MIQTHPSSSPGTNDQQAAAYQRFQANSYINGISSGNSGGIPATQYYNNLNMYPVGRSCTQYFSSSSAASLATSGQMIPIASAGGNVDPQHQSLQRQRLTYDHPNIRLPQWPPTHYPAQITSNYEHQFITTPPSYQHHHPQTFTQPFSPPYSQHQTRPTHYHHVQQAYISQKTVLEDNYKGQASSSQAHVYNTSSGDRYKAEAPKSVMPKSVNKPKKQSKPIAKKPRKPPIPSSKSKLIIDSKPSAESKPGEVEGQSPFRASNIREIMLKECQAEQAFLPKIVVNATHQSSCTDSPSAQEQAAGGLTVGSKVKKKKTVEEVITNKTISSPSPPMLYLPTHKPSKKKLKTGRERQTRLVPMVAPGSGRKKRKNSNEPAPSVKMVEVKKNEDPPVQEEPKKQRPPYIPTRNNYPQTPPDSSSEEEDSQYVEAAVVEESNQEVLPKAPVVEQKIQEPEAAATAEELGREEKEEKLQEAIPRRAPGSVPPMSMYNIPNPDAFEVDNFSPKVYVPADAPSVMIPPLSPINAPSEVTTTTPNSVFCTTEIEKECGARLSEKVLFPEQLTTQESDVFKGSILEDTDEPARGHCGKVVQSHSDVTSPPVVKNEITPPIVKKYPIVPPLKKANWLPAPHVSEFSLPLIIEPTTLDHPWQTVGKRKRRKQSLSVPSAKTSTPSPEPVRTPSVSSTQGSPSNGKESKRSRRRRKRKKIRAQEKARAAEEQEGQNTVSAASEQPPPPAEETTVAQRRSNCDILRECLHRLIPAGWRKEKTN